MKPIFRQLVLALFLTSCSGGVASLTTSGASDALTREGAVEAILLETIPGLTNIRGKQEEHSLVSASGGPPGGAGISPQSYSYHGSFRASPFRAQTTGTTFQTVFADALRKEGNKVISEDLSIFNHDPVGLEGFSVRLTYSSSEGAGEATAFILPEPGATSYTKHGYSVTIQCTETLSGP